VAKGEGQEGERRIEVLPRLMGDGCPWIYFFEFCVDIVYSLGK